MAITTESQNKKKKFKKNGEEKKAKRIKVKHYDRTQNG